MNELILPAWEMLLRYTSLKKFNFIPSFIGMLWLFLILFYQMTFSYVYIFKKKDLLLGWLANFTHQEYFIEVVIGLIVIFLLYTIIIPIAEGGLVEMIHKYRKSEGEIKLRSYEGLFLGVRHYLPLFEVHNLIAVFRPLSVITFYILLLRLFGKEYLLVISVIMSIYLVFAFLLNTCFAYAKYFIIFEHQSAFRALASSTGMAISHISVTIKLYYTMMLLYLRTIIIALFFLGLPFIISAIITYFTIISIQLILLGIFGIITLIFFIIITHLNSTLEIFVEATWYEAYMMNTKTDIAEGGERDGHRDDYQATTPSTYTESIH